MKKMIKAVLIAICFAVTLNIFTASPTVANAKSSIELKSKSDFLIFIRVNEGDRKFIYVFTLNGIFQSKFEEL